MKRLILLLGLAVAGCAASGHVTTTGSTATGALPRPARVVVTDFAITPDQVRLDSGVSAQFLRASSGESMSYAERQAAQSAQAALADTLAAKLESYGLRVEPLPVTHVAPAGSLLVQGQITSLNEGNRTRRMMIGLGAGKSSITADAQLFYIAHPGQPRFLRSFSGSADSGHMPGAAETMGAGAAAQTLAASAAMSAGMHATAESRRTGDAANAGKLAAALARQIGDFAVWQGWIPASAVE